MMMYLGHGYKGSWYGCSDGKLYTQEPENLPYESSTDLWICMHEITRAWEALTQGGEGIQYHVWPNSWRRIVLLKWKSEVLLREHWLLKAACSTPNMSSHRQLLNGIYLGLGECICWISEALVLLLTTPFHIIVYRRIHGAVLGTCYRYSISNEFRPTQFLHSVGAS